MIDFQVVYGKLTIGTTTAGTTNVRAICLKLKKRKGGGLDARSMLNSRFCILSTPPQSCTSSPFHKLSNLMPEQILFTIPLLPPQPSFTPRTRFHSIILRENHTIHPRMNRPV